MKKILYVNKNQVRKTLSAKTFKEDLVYSAHTEETQSFSAYISLAYLKTILSEAEIEKIISDLTE